MTNTQGHSATRKIAYNTGIQVAGKFVITMIAAVSVAIITRYLGPAGYGKFTIALVFLSFFSIVADLGLFTIVVKRISEDESQTERIVGNAMSLRAVFSITMMALAVLIGYILPYTPDVKLGIAIASTSLIFGLLNSSLITVFQARLRMDYAVIADIVGRAASLIAVLIVIKLNLGFYWIVGTATVGTLGSFLVSWYFARRFTRVHFLGDRKMWRELFVESIPFGLTIAVTFIYFRVDTFMLSLFRSNTEVGFYGAAFKVLDILITVPGFFVNSVFPVLTKYLADGDDRVRPLVQQAFDSMALLGIPIAVGMVVLGGPIVRLVGGSAFDQSALALQLLAPALAFSFLNLLFGNMIVAKGRFKTMLGISAGILAVNILLNIATLPAYGFRAAAINTVISEGIVFITSMLIARHLYGFRPSFGTLPRIIIAAAVMGALVWLARPAGPFVAALVGAIVYGAATYAFNGPAKAALYAITSKSRA